MKLKGKFRWIKIRFATLAVIEYALSCMYEAVMQLASGNFHSDNKCKQDAAVHATWLNHD